MRIASVMSFDEDEDFEVYELESARAGYIHHLWWIVQIMSAKVTIWLE